MVIIRNRVWFFGRDTTFENTWAQKRGFWKKILYFCRQLWFCATSIPVPIKFTPNMYFRSNFGHDNLFRKSRNTNPNFPNNNHSSRFKWKRLKIVIQCVLNNRFLQFGDRNMCFYKKIYEKMLSKTLAEASKYPLLFWPNFLQRRTLHTNIYMKIVWEKFHDQHLFCQKKTEL